MKAENYDSELKQINLELKGMVNRCNDFPDLEIIKKRILEKYPGSELDYSENGKEVRFYITNTHRRIGLITTLRKSSNHV